MEDFGFLAGVELEDGVASSALGEHGFGFGGVVLGLGGAVDCWQGAGIAAHGGGEWGLSVLESAEDGALGAGGVGV